MHSISDLERTRPPRTHSRWWRSASLWILVASIATIYAFVRFGSEVTERETTAFDAVIRQWIMTHRSETLLGAFGIITDLGTWPALFAAAVVIAAVLLRRGRRKRPLLVAAAPFALSCIVYLLKDSYRVTRPPAGLASALTFSFPSGHTSGSTAVYAVLAYVLSREGVVRPPFAWAFGVTVPLVVGVSRLYLDRHWASDVIGGWMIGAAYAAIVCVMYEHARQRRLSMERQRADI